MKLIFALLFLLPLTLLSLAQEASQPVKLDFQTLALGPLPDDIMVFEGTFKVVADGDNKLLELGVEPMTEGGVLLGKSMKKGGTVKAKIKATGKRRSFPRFAVGMCGTTGFRFRAVPGEKLVEFVKEDARVAKMDFTWKSAAWYWVELSVLPIADQTKWKVEGRIWEDGQARPDVATLSHELAEQPSSGKASIWGAPFSEIPIQFDDIELVPAP